MRLLDPLYERFEPLAGDAHAPAHVGSRVRPPRHGQLRLVEHDVRVHVRVVLTQRDAVVLLQGRLGSDLNAAWLSS